jgi:hypothetical protein
MKSDWISRGARYLDSCVSEQPIQGIALRELADSLEKLFRFLFFLKLRVLCVSVVKLFLRALPSPSALSPVGGVPVFQLGLFAQFDVVTSHQAVF